MKSIENELKHLAIIMDGNGRWAKNHNKLRNIGHQEGAKIVRTITEFVAKTDIKFLTLYAFSTENWTRPKSEVSALMKLLETFLKNEQETLMKNSIKFNVIGDMEPFSKKLKELLQSTQKLTQNNTNLTQTLALNYGSKDEIVRAIKRLNVQNQEINEQTITKALDTKDMPDVDLLIRTGGESRLSNYLLWQAAYAELRFTKTLWPDFNAQELGEIIASYKNVHRRFGGL